VPIERRYRGKSGRAVAAVYDRQLNRKFRNPRPPIGTIQEPDQFLLSRETNMTGYDRKKDDGRFPHSHRRDGENR
jgi:hypothetical protein